MNSFIRSLSAVIIGLLLIFLKDSVMPMMVRVVGVAFFVPALVSILNIYATRKGANVFPMVLISLVDIGSMFFGLWLIISPVTFLELFVIMLAVVLLCFSVFQIYMVLSSCRRSGMCWSLMATPAILAVLSVVVLANPFGTVTTASFVLGVCAIVSGVSDILISLLVRRKRSSEIEIVE